MAKSERKQAQVRDVAAEKLAAMFKALGDPTRLRIFEFLRANSGLVALNKKGGVRLLGTEGGESEEGITVGEVGFHVTGGSKDPSTVSHHLKELRQAGLISMERHGKNMICALHPDALSTLRDFCCVEETPKTEEKPEKAATVRRRRVKDAEITGLSELTTETAEPPASPATDSAPAKEETAANGAATRKKKKKE